MRHPRSVVHGRATGLGALLLTLACVTPDVARNAAATGAATPDTPAARAARKEIARQIARRVDATRRKDADALLADAGAGWVTPDGRRLTREDMREALLREWEPVERTIDFTVHIDSLRLVDPDSAVVYTSQRWERILVTQDGSRHAVATSAWMEQPWTRRSGAWRGAGGARQLRAGRTLVDGREVGVVVAEP